MDKHGRGSKLGRNDPCPCGSGRKYKACCLTAQSAVPGIQAAGIPALMQGAFAHHQRGRLDEAASLYGSVLRRDPRHADALYLLGVLLAQQGRLPEALGHFARRLSVGDSAEAKLGFANCMKQMAFTQDGAEIRRLATRALSEAWISPRELVDPALGLVLLDDEIRGCFERAVAAWPCRLSRQALFGTAGLAALAGDGLLRSLLQSSPMQSIAMERFLTQARHALLELVTDAGAVGLDDEALLAFCCALARQCFLNEYVCDATDGEIAAAEALRGRLEALLSGESSFPRPWLAMAAAYFPLEGLACAERLLALDCGQALAALVDQQVREPRRERQLRAQIPALTAIGAGVSSQVQAQYEENPYPRWTRAPAILAPLSIDEFLQRIAPARFRPLARKAGMDVLIAGCGTGFQSICSAQLYSGSRLLAVDLSLASLGYARRKTEELGLTNIDYAQADITRLGALERRFDLIESIGVLHHLEDPEAGWRTLVDLLRPGGVMLIALYSELGRQDIVAARRYISERGYTPTADGIRRCRQDILALEGSDWTAELLQRWDFFGTSECRDLLFHTQEHRFTLPRLKEMLARLGLRFLGFQLGANLLHKYGMQFPGDPEMANLDNWHQFETANPRTFRGMYLFWVQK